MIYSLTGRLTHKEESFAVVECGGVGYLILCSQNTLSKLSGDAVTVFTYMHVTENSLDLFGFYCRDELEAFKMLISVSGVGPKAALAILSQFSPDALVLYIASGDSKMITRAQGIGPKLAQRIVLELKPKAQKLVPGGSIKVSSEDFSEGQATVGSDSVSQAISALTVLGYGRSEAVMALSDASPEMGVDDLIRHALKNLSRM